MYLRAKTLDKVLELVKSSIKDGVIVSGQFIKVGFDDNQGVLSYWCFIPDYEDGG